MAKASLKEWGPADLSSERLANAVRKVAREVKQDGHTGDQFYIAAAELAVSECTRLKIGSPQADALFRRPAQGEMMPWTYSARLFSVADALFALRDCDGFDILCERASRADLQVFAADLYAARMFHEAGYKVAARLESGVKKHDYDFSVSKDFRRVNVEVTAIEGDGHAPTNVYSTLKKKRTQLPEDAPAVSLQPLNPRGSKIQTWTQC